VMAVIMKATAVSAGRQAMAHHHLARVVAGIAFGGLVPMTTALVADIVRFSVGDCLTDMNQGERDMRAMEKLMTLVQEGVYKRTNQWIPLFGGQFLDRLRQKRAADHFDYGGQALGVFDEDMTDTVRHMGQYTTPLEALIARVDGKTLPHADNPFEKGAMKRKAVFDACVTQIEGAYRDAVSRLRDDKPRKTFSIADSLEKPSERSDLGDENKEEPKPIMKVLENPHGRLSAEQCGTMARCIIQVWTRFVRTVEWDQRSPTVTKESRQKRQQRQRKDSAVFIPQGVKQGVMEEKQNAETYRPRVGNGRFPYRPVSLEELPDIAVWE